VEIVFGCLSMKLGQVDRARSCVCLWELRY